MRAFLYADCDGHWYGVMYEAGSDNAKFRNVDGCIGAKTLPLRAEFDE